MLIRKNQNPNELQIKVFEILAGLEAEDKQQREKQASKNYLRARRAIEQRREQKELENQINDACWLDNL